MPSIEQAILPTIPWLIVQSAVKTAFGNDADNWEVKMVEAKGVIPEHLTVTVATNNPNAQGRIQPTFLVVADHILQPTGSLRLVYYVWGPRRGVQGNQVVDLHHQLLCTVSDYCEVAEVIALRWREIEVDNALRAEFGEPDFDFDIGDSAFDRTVADNAVGDGVTETGASEGNGNQGNGNQGKDGFTDVIF